MVLPQCRRFHWQLEGDGYGDIGRRTMATDMYGWLIWVVWEEGFEKKDFAVFPLSFPSLNLI